MMTVEQVLAVQKTNLETVFGLGSKAFEGVEKLVELNLQVARTSMGEVAETAKAALSVKDAQELMALQAGLLQPAAEKAAAYTRYVYEIAATTNADLTKIAESQIAEVQEKFMSAIDSVVKNAPAGSENTVALVKSAISVANNAYESVHKATKQAADMAEANMQALTSTAVKASQSASKSRRSATTTA